MPSSNESRIQQFLWHRVVVAAAFFILFCFSWERERVIYKYVYDDITRCTYFVLHECSEMYDMLVLRLIFLLIDLFQRETAREREIAKTITGGRTNKNIQRRNNNAIIKVFLFRGVEHAMEK